MEKLAGAKIEDKNIKLKDHLVTLLTKQKFLDFFDLEKRRVHQWLETMVFNESEIRFSPGYESAGWGHNQTRKHEMAASSIGTADSTYEHESRHGLHNLKCQTLFEGEDNLEYLKKFKETVLEDKKFIDIVDKSGGSVLQERMLKKVRELASDLNTTSEQVKEHAWMFGALTYQHAYSIDAGICESVASFGDNDVTLAIDEYNQWFAKLLIPGRQFFEGYANTDWQMKFQKADNDHKAFLIRSENYNFDTYWAS